jgi:TrmH family RNA methyltransferase
VLTSVQNPRVKAAAALRDGKERRRRGLFAVEGAREIARALECGFALEELFVCDEELSEPASAILADLYGSGREALVVAVAAGVMKKLVVREGSDGLCGVFKTRSATLASLTLGTSPLLLAVESLEKPGNLGALLRSADGAGCSAVVALGQTVDVFNPLVIRASLGTVFHVPVVPASNDEFAAFCRERGLKVHAAALTPRSRVYTDVDLREPAVILLGSEADGLSEYWLTAADALVQIPMLGVADSLNAATAGAVLVYEALRQRRGTK